VWNRNVTSRQSQCGAMSEYLRLQPETGIPQDQMEWIDNSDNETAFYVDRDWTYENIRTLADVPSDVDDLFTVPSRNKKGHH